VRLQNIEAMPVQEEPPSSDLIDSENSGHTDAEPPSTSSPSSPFFPGSVATAVQLAKNNQTMLLVSYQGNYRLIYVVPIKQF